jgi:cytochrome c-type biogenesis protein
VESIYLVSFVIGFFSFLSPCIIPMITVYFTLITGLSLEDLQSATIQKRMKVHIIISTLVFILGFTLVFTLIGGLVSEVGHFVKDNIRYFNIVGGVFIILLGLKMAGLIKLNFLHKLDFSNRVDVRSVPQGYKYLSTFLVGIFFAIVCFHCIAPTFYSVIMLTGTTEINGAVVMFFFSIGLGVPYLLVGLSFNKSIPMIKRLGKYRRDIQLVMALILINLGIFMMTNKLTLLTKILDELLPFKLPYSF